MLTLGSQVPSTYPTILCARYSVIIPTFISYQMDIMLNGVLVDELSTIIHVSRLEYNAKRLTAKLKEMIPRQMVQVIAFFPIIFIIRNY